MKEQFIQITPLLQVIQRGTVDNPALAINTPHGIAVLKEYRCGVRVQYSRYAVHPYAFRIAKDRLLRTLSRELTFALAGQQVTDMVHVPAQYKSERGWVLLCSNENFMRFARAEPYQTEFDWTRRQYKYDGLPLLRHDLPTDIFVNVERSAIYNLAVTQDSKAIAETATSQEWEHRVSVRAYWYIDSPTAQPL
jgi:hypothetical protein